MPIEPIQPTQGQPNSLLQILQGGSQHIAGILDRAIQIGRDISNKRTQQEQDMLAMRQQETSLQQRRAENLQQNIEDAQKFARGAYEFDTRLGMEQDKFNATQQRASVQDLLQQQNADRNYALAARHLGITEEEYRRRAVAEAGIIRGLQDSVYGEQQSAPQNESQSAPSVAEMYGTLPDPVYSNQSGLFSPPKSTPPEEVATGAASLLTPTQRPAVGATSTAPLDREALSAEIAALLKKEEAALELKKRGDSRAGAKAEYYAQQRARLETRFTDSKPATAPDPQLVAIRQAKAERDAADQQMQEEKNRVVKIKTEAASLIADPNAFVRPFDYLNEAGKVDAERKNIKATARELTEAENYDADPLAAEIAYAKDHTSAASYAKALNKNKTLDPKIAAKREKFWYLVKQMTPQDISELTSGEKRPSVPRTASPLRSDIPDAEDWMMRSKGDMQRASTTQ